MAPSSWTYGSTPTATAGRDDTVPEPGFLEVCVKLYVEFEKCCGFGECVALAPDLFRLGDDNRALYIGEETGADLADEGTAQRARDAAYTCPAEAIRIDA